MTFTIDVDKWLRGKGSINSYLLRPEDGRQCCIGLYLTACGIPDEVLNLKRAAGTISCDLPNDALWLMDSSMDGDIDSDIAEIFYYDNDSQQLTESERRTRIRRQFSLAGIQVLFSDEALAVGAL